MRFLTEQYENEKTGQKIDGITIMIDGKLKQLLDIIIEKEGQYSNYSEVIRDVLFFGIDNFINKYRHS